jgi:hypothetical protein
MPIIINKLMSRSLIIFTFVNLLSFSVFSQDVTWKQSIPNNKSWKAEIQKSRTESYNAATGVMLTHKDISLVISDFTGNFFKQYADTTSFPVEIKFNGNTIVPVTIESSYGPCKLDGNWNPQTKKLTINWKIDFNRIDETTILTLLEN